MRIKAVGERRRNRLHMRHQRVAKPLVFLTFRKNLAGAVGFEPTVHGTKNRCLTTWPRPNCGALSN